LSFNSFDATNSFTNQGAIGVRANGVQSSTSKPTRLEVELTTSNTTTRTTQLTITGDGGVSFGSDTTPNSRFNIQGGYSASSIGSVGAGFVIQNATYNENTDVGVITTLASHSFSGATHTSTNAISVTDLVGVVFGQPTASTNVTATNVYSLSSNNIRVNGNIDFSNANRTIGTRDAFSLDIKTNNINRINISNSGDISLLLLTTNGYLKTSGGTGLLSVSSAIPQSDVTNLTTDLASKQATLVSGTNIKTINGNSILGAGDLVISGGSGEVNTASNTGTVGVGIFKQKTGVDLELYKINPLNNKVSIALNGTDRIDVGVNEANFTGIPLTAINNLSSASNASQSITAKSFWASPSGASGVASYRAIVPSDIPTLNQNTTGTASNITATSNTSLTSLANLTTHGIVTSGGLGTGATIGGTTMALGADASFDMYYRNASGVLTRLPAGTSGQFLQTNGTASAPIWQTLAGGGDMLLSGTQTVTGAKTFNAGTLILGANTASASPLKFTPTSAVLETNPTTGDFEVDANGLLYYSHNNSERGVVIGEQFMVSNATYTLVSQTALQKLFNTPTNGAFTAKGATAYYFECEFDLSAMSTTSGTFGFGFLGTATYTSIRYTATSAKAAIGTASASQIVRGTGATSQTLTTASTATTGRTRITGIIRVNAGGTIIPSVSLSTASAGVIQPNAVFKVYPIGTNTVTSLGNFN
jgi:hypothetical protein